MNRVPTRALRHEQICNNTIYLAFESRHGSVSIVTTLRADGIRVQFPAVTGNIFLHNHMQTGSAARPASCPVDIALLSTG
jgi:hypothetical protein